MPGLMDAPPYSNIENVTEVFHGVPITDPYRWLEVQNSASTRDWIAAQTRYTRFYLDSIPGREQIQRRIRALVDVETYDSVQKIGNRYFFRKRLAGQEQPCICVRNSWDGQDEVLVDPATHSDTPFSAVKLLQVSADGCFLLYEIKDGGERSGRFAILDVRSRKTLPETLPRGYLRGFAFSPDSKAFYYVHEPVGSSGRAGCAAYKHALGSDFSDDVQVFCAGEEGQTRLHIVPGAPHLGFLVIRFSAGTSLDFYLWTMGSAESPRCVVSNADYTFGPVLLNNGSIIAITNDKAPNFRIVVVRQNTKSEWVFEAIVPEVDVPIQDWAVLTDRVLVSYFRRLKTETHIFSFSGERIGSLPVESTDTIRFLPNSLSPGRSVFRERVVYKAD